MARTTYEKTATDSQGTYKTEVYDNTSVSSPRVSGKLILQSNPHEFAHSRCSRRTVGGFPNAVPQDAGSGVGWPFDGQFSPMANACLAKFTSKVRKHNASLGVTLASWGQSRDMIVSRSQKLAQVTAGWEKRIEKLSPRERRRLQVQGRASDILEWQFGWVPLVKDIQDSFGALGRDAPPTWIAAAVKQRYQAQVIRQGFPWFYDERDVRMGELRLAIGSSVVVTNPNVWLLNRLGLLNLPGVAWDLVPWSFVVNMFTNCGQMVNSVTDFVGLTLGNGNMTKSAKISRDVMFVPGIQNGQYQGPGYAESNISYTFRRRTLGIPTPSFQFRAPQLDLGLAAIAWGLIGQRVGRINKLLGMANK